MDGENTTATAGGFTDDLSDLTTARVQPLERAVPVPSTDLWAALAAIQTDAARLRTRLNKNNMTERGRVKLEAKIVANGSLRDHFFRLCRPVSDDVHEEMLQKVREELRGADDSMYASDDSSVWDDDDDEEGFSTYDDEEEEEEEVDESDLIDQGILRRVQELRETVRATSSRVQRKMADVTEREARIATMQSTLASLTESVAKIEISSTRTNPTDARPSTEDDEEFPFPDDSIEDIPNQLSVASADGNKPGLVPEPAASAGGGVHAIAAAAPRSPPPEAEAQTETVTADGKIGLGSGVRVIAVRERRPAAGGTMTTAGVPIAGPSSNEMAMMDPTTMAATMMTDATEEDGRRIFRLCRDVDKEALSERQCYVRQRYIQAFTAISSDVSSRPSKGAKMIRLGQVGIRCVFCKHLSIEDRAERAVCYPRSVSRLYQTIADMQRKHFVSCKCIPSQIQETYRTLKTNRKHGQVAPHQYWAQSANEIGLIDSPDGSNNGGIFYSAAKAAEKAAEKKEADEKKAETKAAKAENRYGDTSKSILEMLDGAVPWRAERRRKRL